MNKEQLTEKIHKALLEKSKNKDSFELKMIETGNTVKVKYHHRGPYKSCGHWHGSSYYLEVTTSSETRYFKSFSGLAKSIAYGYIK